MKKNRYGNIDDILINVKVVTPSGTFTKKQDCPRVSSGPDLNQFILGSEGTLGVITEAVIKLRNMPKTKVFDSIIFHDFEIGIKLGFSERTTWERRKKATLKFAKLINFYYE